MRPPRNNPERANRLIWREYRGVMTDQFEQARAEAEAQVEQARAEKAAKDSAIAAALRQSQEQAERVARQDRESLVVRPEVPPFGELLDVARQILEVLQAIQRELDEIKDHL